jgi:hypothetical protein
VKIHAVENSLHDDLAVDAVVRGCGDGHLNVPAFKPDSSTPITEALDMGGITVR